MSHDGHDLDTSQTSTNNGRGEGEDYDAEKADAGNRNGGLDKMARIGNEESNGEAAGKNKTEEEPFDNDYEVRWDGDSDPMSPRNFGNAKKWLIVLVVSAGSTCVTCTSSMYTLTYEQITVEFGVSRVVATLGLSLFVMGLGIGPMVLGPLSEFYGRRPIYIVSFTFFLIWLVGLFFVPILTLPLVVTSANRYLLVWGIIVAVSRCFRSPTGTPSHRRRGSERGSSVIADQCSEV